MKNLNRFFAVIILFVLYHNNSFSQTASVSWGKEITNEAEPGNILSPATVRMSYQVIGHEGSEIFVIATKLEIFTFKKEYFFEKYSTSTTDLLLHKKLEFVDPGLKEKTVNFINAELVNGKIIAFADISDKKLKKKWVFAQEINRDGTFAASSIKLDEIDYFTNPSEFLITFSKDKSKVLCCRTGSLNLELPSKACVFKVFDANFKELWANTYDLKHKSQDTQIRNTLVDDAGNAHMLIRTRDSYHEKYIEYKLVSFYSDIKKFKEYTLGAPNKYLSAINTDFDKEGNIVCVGLYANVETTNYAKDDRLNGAFYIKIDRNTKEINKNEYTALNINTIKQLDFGIKNAPIYQFASPNIVFDKEGNITLCTDQYYYSSSLGMSSNYNIIAVKLNTEGKIIWEKYISKAQKETLIDVHISYAYIYFNNNIYFIFNDHPSNLNQVTSQKVSVINKFDKSILVLVQLNDKGELKKEIITKSDDKYLQPVIDKPTFQIGSNEFMIFVEKGNKYKFGKMVLK